MQIRLGVIVFLVFFVGILAFVLLYGLYDHHTTIQPSLHEMLNIIRLQNHTIAMLHSRVSSDQPQTSQSTQCESSHQASLLVPSSALQSMTPQHHISISSFEDECEERYGFRLADNWRHHQQVWCSSQDQSSKLLCYPYRQKHKDSDDVFCVAENFVVDFSKVVHSCMREFMSKGLHNRYTENMQKEINRR